MPINDLSPLKDNILPEHRTLPQDGSMPGASTGSSVDNSTPDFLPPPATRPDDIAKTDTAEQLYNARRFPVYDPTKTENEFRWGQTGWARTANTLDNLVEKTGAYIIQNAGFIGGAIPAAIGGTANMISGNEKGNTVSLMTDNFLVKLGEAWKEKVQERAPIYKSDYYSKGTIWGKLATTDWWLDGYGCRDN